MDIVKRALFEDAYWSYFRLMHAIQWELESDTEECLKLLRERLLPQINLFCYGQVESQYGSGQFLQKLEKGLTEEDNVALSKIGSREEIYRSIKEFLGKGR